MGNHVEARKEDTLEAKDETKKGTRGKETDCLGSAIHAE